MRKSLAVVFAFALIAVAFLPLTAAAGEHETWTGWITDEGCGAKGAKAEHKACAVKCHKDGLALVFYNNADEKLYKLSDQELAAANLGHEVKVEGELDGDTITVASIESSGEMEDEGMEDEGGDDGHGHGAHGHGR